MLRDGLMRDYSTRGVPATPGSATMPSLNEGPMPSYRTAKKRQTMEDRHGRCRSAQRGSASVEISGPCALATPLGSILWMRLPGNGWSGYYRRSRVEI